jgi:hypothetical protein
MGGDYESRSGAKSEHLGAGQTLHVPDPNQKGDRSIVSKVELDGPYVRLCLGRISRRSTGQEQ